MPVLCASWQTLLIRIGSYERSLVRWTDNNNMKGKDLEEEVSGNFVNKWASMSRGKACSADGMPDEAYYLPQLAHEFNSGYTKFQAEVVVPRLRKWIAG